MKGKSRRQKGDHMEKRIRLCALCALLLMAGNSAFADITGQILGSALDSSGAAVPGVNVAAINTASNLSERTVTDSAGEYRFLSLPAGTYRVEAELKGFQKFVEAG